MPTLELRSQPLPARQRRRSARLWLGVHVEPIVGVHLVGGVNLAASSAAPACRGCVYRMSDAFMGARAGVIVSAGTTSIADRVGLIAIRT